MTNRNFYTFYRVFLVGFQHFVRNSWLTIAATLIMIVTISFVLGGAVLNITSQHIITDLSQSLQIPVYLQKDASIVEINELRLAFERHEAIIDVVYVDSQAAKARFSANYGDDATIGQAFELVGDDVLPASLEISVNDLNNFQVVHEIAESAQYATIVEPDSLGKTTTQTTLERASTIQNNLIRISVILSIVFLAVAILIIFNTIRMTIFARREEILIMRLIGAPSYFVREPFLVEAGLYGIFGGLIAAGLIYGLIWSFSDTITNVPELATSYAYFVEDKSVILIVFASAIIGGTSISILSCSLALRRYLKL